MKQDENSLSIGGVEYKRCGYLPDLFISKDGELIKAEVIKAKRFNSYPVVHYRGHTMAMRSLMADGWLPGWRTSGLALRPRDGDVRNYALENLELVPSKGEGRPPSQALQEQARLYFMYRVYPHAMEIAVNEGISVLQLAEAVRIFDEQLAIKVMADPR